MSTIQFSYTNKICTKLKTVTSYPLSIPAISNLTSYFDPKKNATILNIFGNQFRDFSKVYFGKTEMDIIFISSEYIFIYLTENYQSGSYSIQVFNDNYGSNIVYYTNS